jgi:integrase
MAPSVTVWAHTAFPELGQTGTISLATTAAHAPEETFSLPRGRWGHRDATMILIAYRHGLRVSELVALTWSHVDLEAGRLQVIRCKSSDDSVQPPSRIEIRALRKLRWEQETGARYVFISERGAPLTGSADLLVWALAQPHSSAATRTGRAFVDELDPGSLQRRDDPRQRLDHAADRAVARFHSLNRRKRYPRCLR